MQMASQSTESINSNISEIVMVSDGSKRTAVEIRQKLEELAAE
jgi:hypothetical protein